LLGRLDDADGGEATRMLGQAPRPFPQLVGPDVEPAPDLRDSSARRSCSNRTASRLNSSVNARR
jgi:hypothetical protein